MNQTDDQQENPYRAPTTAPIRRKKLGSAERTENVLQFGFVVVASFTAGILIGDVLVTLRKALPVVPSRLTMGLSVCICCSLIWIVIKWKNRRKRNNSSLGALTSEELHNET